jgi:thiamine kinase-like enzyme
MQPHEWLLTKDGQLLKTDSGSHGDDHFFPGPTDIAWDLAGAIIEWRMSSQQVKEFLEHYRQASGDDASARIDDFIKAYAVFRAAYCMMAANAMSGSDEHARLERAAADYKSVLIKSVLRNESAA